MIQFFGVILAMLMVYELLKIIFYKVPRRIYFYFETKHKLSLAKTNEEKHWIQYEHDARAADPDY